MFDLFGSSGSRNSIGNNLITGNDSGVGREIGRKVGGVIGEKVGGEKGRKIGEELGGALGSIVEY